jgi:hypothetical protein
MMKAFLFVCSLLLFAALAKMPNGYYTFLRITITIGALSVFFLELKSNLKFWPFVFALVAVLFNPVLPIYFHDKHAWPTIDTACGILFAVKGFTLHK